MLRSLSHLSHPSVACVLDIEKCQLPAEDDQTIISVMQIAIEFLIGDTTAMKYVLKASNTRSQLEAQEHMQGQTTSSSSNKRMQVVYLLPDNIVHV